MPQSESIDDVRLPGPLTIGTVANAHAELLASLQRGSHIVVHVGPDAHFDVAGVQLLQSARHYARLKSKRVALATPASGELLEVLRLGGILENCSSDDRQFWLHEGRSQ